MKDVRSVSRVKPPHSQLKASSRDLDTFGAPVKRGDLRVS